MLTYIVSSVNKWKTDYYFLFEFFLKQYLFKNIASGIAETAITGKQVKINIPRKAKTSTPHHDKIGMCKNPAKRQSNDATKNNHFIPNSPFFKKHFLSA